MTTPKWAHLEQPRHQSKYATLKHNAAQQNPHDREACTAAKAAFIAQHSGDDDAPD
ncbi:MAG TPA: GrpB family protein [Candidatus Dormibacteraeota bacterium]|nr:GrpB family protein [Candidatus Dormibacteraeota bacterium]